MLTFDTKKSKALSMPVLVDGIDQSFLTFKMVIEVNGVDYGFKAKHEGDSVKFVIPPLEGVVGNISEGIYNARLEVSTITEGDRGFYMQPWAEQISVKRPVTVEVVSPKEETTVTESANIVNEGIKLKVSSLFSEHDLDESEVSVIIEEEKVKTKPNKHLRDLLK